jgi:uncharacterized membrane protein
MNMPQTWINIMNTIGKFIINTLTGGIFFLLPLAVVFIILKKVYEIMTKVLDPVAKHLPDGVFGLDSRQIIAVFVLIIFCFMAGLLFRSKRIRAFIEKLEDGYLSAIPGYTFIMTNVADKLHHKDDDTLVPVLVLQSESQTFGFLAEESDGLCSVYIPGAPDYKSGNVHIFPASAIQKLDISASAVTKSLKSLGKGSIRILKPKDSFN